MKLDQKGNLWGYCNENMV